MSENTSLNGTHEDTDIKMASRRLAAIVDALQEVTHNHTTLLTLRTFLAVGIQEGQGVTEIAERLGAANATISRQLLDLGIRNRKLEDGFGLVEPHVDRSDLRKRAYYLTGKGREAMTYVVRQLMSDEALPPIATFRDGTRSPLP